MARYLRDPVPCSQCSTPTRVRSKAEAEHARCEHCTEVRRLLKCANDREWLGTRHREAAAKQKGPQEVAEYLRAAAERLSAAAYVLEASAKGMKGLTPAQERAWITWARGRAAWGTAMAANALPLVERERGVVSNGLVVIPGESQLTETPSYPTVLRIVRLLGEE